MSFSPLAELLIVVIAHWMIAWFFTYLIHSTVLIGAAAILERYVPSGATRSSLWRFSLVGGVATATIQMVLGEAVGTPPLRAGELPPMVSRIPGTALILLGLAVLFCIVTSLWIIGREWWAIRRLRCRPLPRKSGYRAMLADLTSRARLPVPELIASPVIGSPAVIGHRKICLPLPFFGTLPPNQQKALLAHELGHVARRDTTWLLTLSLIARVLGIQTLNRFALERLRVALEDAADEFAVRLTDPFSLAEALVALAPFGASRPAAGTAASGATLFHRVDRILSGGAAVRGIHPWLRRLAGALGLAAVITLGPGVGGSSEISSNAIPWLAPSKEAPNDRMLEIRRINRRNRDFFRNLSP